MTPNGFLIQDLTMENHVMKEIPAMVNYRGVHGYAQDPLTDNSLYRDPAVRSLRDRRFSRPAGEGYWYVNEFVSDPDLLKEYLAGCQAYEQDKLRPYPECACTPYCQKSCSLANRILGRDIARRLFVKHIGQGCSDRQKFDSLCKNFTANINSELNDEELTPELKACIRVHLVRHLRYETDFNFSDGYYAKFLSNI